MATFKICVRKRRNDGFWPVYVRVTHNRKVGYIKTDKVVNDGGLRKGEIKDAYVLNHTSKLVVQYMERLNKVDTSLWDLANVIEYIQLGEDDVCFSEYARRHIDKMINEGRARTARNYELALQHLERFIGTNKVMFSQLTSVCVGAWIESLSKTRRAKEMYAVNIRQIFRAAIKELNDYDRNVIRIRTNPWIKIDIPSADKSEQIAITPEDCRTFFSAPLPESIYKHPKAELGRDVAMMILCLAGINTVDLYHLEKRDYYDGILHYKRSKTKGKRTDEAYMEMRVPSILQPIFEKYTSPPSDDRLFVFHSRHSSSDSFNAAVNCGIKELCKSIGLDKSQWYSAYTFRHTWGTIAQNDCGANIVDVAFGLNHSISKVTRGYVKIDYSPAWELNEKVVELVFFTDTKSHREQHEEKSFEKFSTKNLMKGTAFFKGKALATIQDIGYHNIDEIIKALSEQLPDYIPTRSIVQYKIENCDKKQTAIYERMKN